MPDKNYRESRFSIFNNYMIESIAGIFELYYFFDSYYIRMPTLRNFFAVTIVNDLDFISR
jgi:hypothetical protein